MMCCVLKFANLCMDIRIFQLLWILYKIISCMNLNYGMIGYNLMPAKSVRKKHCCFLILSERTLESYQLLAILEVFAKKFPLWPILYLNWQHFK